MSKVFLELFHTLPNLIFTTCKPCLVDDAGRHREATDSLLSQSLVVNCTFTLEIGELIITDVKELKKSKLKDNSNMGKDEASKSYDHL